MGVILSMSDFIKENKSYKKYVPNLEHFLLEMAREKGLFTNTNASYFFKDFDENGEYKGNVDFGDGYKIVRAFARHTNYDWDSETNTESEDSSYNHSLGVSTEADQASIPLGTYTVDVLLQKDEGKYQYLYRITYNSDEETEETTGIKQAKEPTLSIHLMSVRGDKGKITRPTELKKISKEENLAVNIKKNLDEDDIDSMFEQGMVGNESKFDLVYVLETYLFENF